MDDPKRIAIFRMGHLGDTIIAMPAFWTIRRRFPDAEILYLSQVVQLKNRVQTLDVLRQGTVYDKIVTYSLGGGKVSKWEAAKTLVRMRLQRIDMLCYLPSYRTNAQLTRDKKFFQLAGIKRVVGLEPRWGLVGYDRRVLPLPTVRQETETLLAYLAHDGIVPDVDPKSLKGMGLSDDERLFASKLLSERGIRDGTPLVGVGPGSKMPSKLWPLDRFVQVCRGLEARHKPNFLVFGSPAERELCQQLCDSLGSAVNVAGEFSVRQSAAVFEHCKLYLGNDTGTMHIAASADVRCVALFSARDWPGRWYPYGDGHVVFRHAVDCEGCMLDTCDKNNLCLDLVKAEPVLEAASKALAETLVP